MHLHLQNPVNWACFTGLEDNDKVIIIMNTGQESVTLGLLRLTLNKLIHCHSSTGSPLLSTLQLHHHSSASSRAACKAQSPVVTQLLPESSTAQVMMPLSRHSPLPAQCCQARTGLHRNLQLFTSSASGIPGWRCSSQHRQAPHVLGFLPGIVKWAFFVLKTFLRHTQEPDYCCGFKAALRPHRQVVPRQKHQAPPTPRRIPCLSSRNCHCRFLRKGLTVTQEKNSASVATIARERKMKAVQASRGHSKRGRRRNWSVWIQRRDQPDLFCLSSPAYGLG